MDLAADESVDEGAVVIAANGNDGPDPNTVGSPACSFNSIGVGDWDDMNNPNIMGNISASSSRGHTLFDGTLKPDIIALGTRINSPDNIINYADFSGTSAAAPVVSGAAGLVLQAHPEYSPVEVKASLLVGAKWNPTNVTDIPSNSTGYEVGGSADLTLNAVGLGLLDVNRTLTLTNTGKNIIHDVITENQTKKYSFSANQGEQVKVILAWLKHPLANVTSPFDVSTSNLNFVINRSDTGVHVINGTSLLQNNEFAVFNAPITGSYTITVSAPSVAPEIGSTEIFALASTHEITKVSLLVKEGTFTKTTATGNQNVTGIGFKPKALLLFTTRQATQGTTDIYNLAFGFSNGSSSRSIGVQSNDNAATSNAGRAFGTQALRILSSGTPTVTAQANVTSFNSDGFTLNWTTNDSTASIIHYIALGGNATTNASVSSFVANTTTGNQAVPV
ncbi:MAG: S8 family serine peptidase, partial [Nitrososphaerales archaeon]